MPATQQHTNGADSKTYDYTPVDVDIHHLPPRCGAGRYEATCNVTQKPTNADKLPMLMVEWTLEAVADGNDENQSSIGQRVTDFITLRPEGDAKGRMAKQQLRLLLDRMGLSYDLVPRRVETKSDLEELCAAITGQHLTISVSLRDDPNTGETRERIGYREPREDASASGGSEEVEAQPERAPVRQAPKTAAKPAAKQAAARRR